MRVCLILIMSLPLHVGAGGGSTVGGGGTGVIPPTPEVVDEVILATAGYDHTIKFWQAHTGKCVRTLQHADSQVSDTFLAFDRCSLG